MRDQVTIMSDGRPTLDCSWCGPPE